MRRDGEARAEESAFLAPKTPRHIGWLRFDPFKVNAPRQEKMEPRLGWRRFWRRRVGLDFDFARLNMNFIELPAPEKQSQGNEFCRDPACIHRFHCLPSVVGPKANACGREKAG